MSGRVLRIYRAAAAGAAPLPVDEATLEPDREVTLIESEEIERFNRETGLALADGALRRNVVTLGIRLNGLVQAAGLRARIVRGGSIRPGDAIERVDGAAG